MGFSRPECHRGPIGPWLLIVVNGTSAPGRKEEEPVSADPSARRCFARAVPMMKAAEPGAGDHRRSRPRLAFYWQPIGRVLIEKNRERSRRDFSSRNRE